MQRHTEHHDEVDAAFDRLLGEALTVYAEKQAELGRELARYQRWQWSLDPVAELMLEGDGLPARRIPVTLIGTHVPAAERWTWA